MATKSDSRKIALLAIQPRYADAIFKGKKKVEFRKTRFRGDITHVLVYVTAPVSRILGYFEVENIIEANPPKLWKMFAPVGGILKDDFLTYFSECESGMALEIGKVASFKRPVPLGILEKIKVPPQSFCYISPGEFRKILRRKCA